MRYAINVFGGWKVEVVVMDYFGWFILFEVGVDGVLNVFFWCVGVSDLVYFICAFNCFDSVSWQSEMVVEEGDVGRYMSLEFTVMGMSVIFYFDGD